MKVLQINATYDLGSTGTIIKDIRECCEKNGIDCYVVYAFSKEKKVEKGYKIGNWLSNKLHALLSRIAGKQAYYSYFPTIAFLKYLDRLRPDVVHLHNLHSNYINLPLLLKYLAKNDIKTVITLHDCWWYTGGCFHYTLAGCDKWLKSCGNCPKRKQDTPAYLCDTSAKILADRKKYLLAIPQLTIVGVSEWISNEARKSFLSKTNVQTIRNGIDLNVFKPTPSDIRERLGLEGKFIILGPASKWLQSYNKNALDYFAHNMKPDEVLVLFGVDKTKHPLPSNVMLYGYTQNRQELAELYSCADIFVNTTREDSLALINLEAQACGTPVVTFDATGPKESVDNQCSFSVPAGNYKELYNVVCRCRNRGLLDADISFIRNHFNIDDFASSYLYLYPSI